MSSFVHPQWNERYRPKNLDECILPDRLKAEFAGFIAKGSIPNLLLNGGAGMGKTTLARILCDELGYDMLFINGSLEGRLIDTVRTKIEQFASSMSFSGSRKIVFIDESDMMPEAVQMALRGFIEVFSKNCGFIITCNYKNRLVEPLHSRFTHIDFVFPQEEKAAVMMAFFKRICFILKENAVEFDKKVVAELVAKHYPDFRRILNQLQGYSFLGKIDAGVLSMVGNVQFEILVKMLKEKKFKDIRVWCAQNTLEMQHINRELYDTAYQYVQPTSIPELVLVLNRYQYQNAFVADREINMMAMFTELMANVEWK